MCHSWQGGLHWVVFVNLNLGRRDLTWEITSIRLACGRVWGHIFFLKISWKLFLFTWYILITVSPSSTPPSSPSPLDSSPFCPLLENRKATDFCELILYPTCWKCLSVVGVPWRNCYDHLSILSYHLQIIPWHLPFQFVYPSVILLL